MRAVNILHRMNKYSGLMKFGPDIAGKCNKCIMYCLCHSVWIDNDFDRTLKYISQIKCIVEHGGHQIEENQKL